MRYYLIIDSNPKSINAIQKAFCDVEGYECAGVEKDFTAEVNKVLKFTPELILLNFDSIKGNPFRIIKLLNKTFGILPNYIALTTSYEKAFNAYKNGFVDVVDEPEEELKIGIAIKRYHDTHFPSQFFCVHYYYDYRYIGINDIVLLKADNYTTDFHLKDGTIINGFETLKHTHAQLPFNFQRIHRSFVINSYFVKRIDYGRREINLRYFDKSLPFSKTYQDNIQTIKRILTEGQNPLLG